MSKLSSAVRLGSGMSCARSKVVARATPRSTSSLTRTYATASGSSSGWTSYGKALLPSIGVGFAAGFVYSLVQARRDDSAKCDGAPALTAIETHGYPWTPADALEKDDPENPMRIRMAVWVKGLQDHIVNTLEAIEASHPALPSKTPESVTAYTSPHHISSDSLPDPSIAPKFHRDAWIRPEGGEGSSCVLSNGRVFEKAGVNVSIVHGNLPPAAQRQMRADHATLPVSDTPLPFFATGISIVIHPRNPHVPTVHLNYRYFEVENPSNVDQPIAWWFGGGSDLTPSYLVPGDVTHFHSTLKDACDKHHPNYWRTFKDWCDKYFMIPHRKESRGVGGLFFDDLTTASPIHSDKTPDQETIFSFVKDISGAFLPAYVPIVWKNKDQPWNEQERRWQLLRRGRYAEFNLVYDRGTKFGLMTPGARIESILMSLPETARWEYMTDMGKEGTKEGELMDVLRKPREWA